MTNRNFEHFWMNEGFTVYVERKINGLLHGESSREFAALGGLEDLKQSVIIKCICLSKLKYLLNMSWLEDKILLVLSLIIILEHKITM